MEQGTEPPQSLQDATAETPLFEALTAPRLARFLTVEYCDSGVIKCTHHVHSLDDKPRYLALSYHWGSSHESRAIELNGRKIGVTDSLYGALGRLEPLVSGARLFWVDALCINQQDDAEKGQQILLMHDIYTNACIVVGWLGEPDRFDNESHDILQKSATAIRQYWRSEGLIKGLGRMLSSPEDAMAGFDFPPTAQTGLGNQSCFERILEIYVKPSWWRRTWIVQEFTLADTFLFLYGGHVIHLKELELAWQAMESVLVPNDLIRSICAERYNSMLLFHLRGEIIKGLKLDLLRNILLTRSFQATDPRDKVYGVLGLTTNDFAIVPDYTLTTEEVFMDTALRIMRHSGKLDALSILYHTTRHPHISLLPWVSDLRASKGINAIDSMLRFSEQERFFASGHTNCKVETRNHAMKLEAFVFDEIAYLRTTPEYYLVENGTMENRVVEEDSFLASEAGTKCLLRACERGAFDLGFPMRVLNIRGEAVMYSFEKGTKYPTGEDIDVACIRTMTFDATPKHLMPLKRKHFKALAEHYQILLQCLRSCRNVEDMSEYVRVMTTATMLDTVHQYNELIKQDVQAGPSMHESQWENVVEGITKKGYFVMAPLKAAEVGDKVILCKGGRLPYLMRETAEGKILKGACFIHGIMYGEAWDADRCEDMWFV